MIWREGDPSYDPGSVARIGAAALAFDQHFANENPANSNRPHDEAL
jgi:hypothetical protein